MESGPKLLSYSVVLIAFMFLDVAFLAQRYEVNLHSRADFAEFYAAAKIMAEHRAAPLSFNHLPYELLIFLPFTRWSFPVAHAAWFVFKIFLLAIAYLLLLRNLEQLRPLRSWLLLMSLSFPAVIDLGYGQDTALLLFVYALAFDALVRRRQFGAGCLLGLGLFKYQFIAPFMLPFIRKPFWRMVLGFTLMAVAAILTSFSIVGMAGAKAHGSLLRGLVAAYSPMMMPNLRGFVFALFGRHLGNTALSVSTIVLSLVVLLGFIKCVPKQAWTDRHQFPLLFSLATIATLLVSYHALLYNLALLAVPVLVLANGAKPEHRVPLVAGVLGPPAYMLALGFGCGYLFCVVLMGLAVWILHQLRARSSAPESHLAKSIPTAVDQH